MLYKQILSCKDVVQFIIILRFKFTYICRL